MLVIILHKKSNHNKTIIEIPSNKKKNIKIQKMNVTGDWESFWCCKLKPRGSEKERGEKKRNGISTKISTGKLFFWFRKGNLRPLIKKGVISNPRYEATETQSKDLRGVISKTRKKEKEVQTRWQFTSKLVAAQYPSSLQGLRPYNQITITRVAPKHHFRIID
jgi:hypothetical protein